jgi:hypothetical protein
MIRPLLLSLALCLPLGAADWTLPAANQGNWTPHTAAGTPGVGVPGGIDQYREGGANERLTSAGIDVTEAPYNADNTGATDASSAIQAAIVAAVSGQVVYLPPGTYKITSPIYINPSDSGITIRGAGASSVVYGSTSGQPIFVFVGGGGLVGGAFLPVTGTRTKGTTTMTVSDSSAYPVGDLCTISVQNEEDNTRIAAGSAPTWSHSGFTFLRQVPVRVVATTGTTITFDPPLPWDCTNYDVRFERWSSNQNTGIGMEDFSITFDPAAHPSYGISFENAIYSWAYNITAPEWKKPAVDQNGSVIAIGLSYRSEIRRCDFRTLNPAAYGDDGAIQFSGASSLLIEDNICAGFDSGIYNSGKTYGCVIAYNFFGPTNNYPGHNGHNSLDLWEGNLATFLQMDGYHGSGSHITFYRNLLGRGLIFNRFMYYMALAGNVCGRSDVGDGDNSFGYPNIGNADYVGTANPFTGDFHADWMMTGTLTTRTSASAGVVTASGGDWDAATASPGRLITLKWAGGSRSSISMDSHIGSAITISGGSGDDLPTAATTFTGVWPGTYGYQELDLGVEHTATKADNWIYAAAGGGAFDNNVTDTLPASLFRSSKPAFFGDLTWPPVNPDSPTYSDEIIPAGYRFINGDSEPEPPASSLTTGTLNVGTLNVGG